MRTPYLSHGANRLMNLLSVASAQATARREYFYHKIHGLVEQEEKLKVKKEYISLYVDRHLKDLGIKKDVINDICTIAANNFEILRSKHGTVYLRPQGNPNTIAKEA